MAFALSENLWLAARTCGLRFSHTSLSVVAAADEKGRVQRLPPEQRSGSELNVLAGTAVYAAPPAQAPVQIETSHRIFGLSPFLPEVTRVWRRLRLGIRRIRSSKRSRW